MRKAEAGMVDHFMFEEELGSEGCFIFSHGVLRKLVLMSVYTFEHEIFGPFLKIGL